MASPIPAWHSPGKRRRSAGGYCSSQLCLGYFPHGCFLASDRGGEAACLRASAYLQPSANLNRDGWGFFSGTSGKATRVLAWVLDSRDRAVLFLITRPASKSVA